MLLPGERSSEHGRSRGHVGATVREPREGAHSGSAASILLVTGAFALAATAILLGLACLQAQLVVGRPLGRFAWGGAHEVLPPGLRVASALSIVLYGVIALVLLDAAGVVDVLRRRWTGTAAWVLAGFFLLVAAMNAASRSRDERRMGTPVALALCLLCVAIAVDA